MFFPVQFQSKSALDPSSGAASFSPLDLTPSLWIDPSDTSVMFVSNAGTTTVTNTSACGYAGDKSGNAFHLTSVADDTTRPSWNTSGGLSWLNFDGSNDVLRKTAALGLYAASSGNSVFLALKTTTAVSKILVGDSASTSLLPLYGIGSDASTSSTMSIAIKNDAGSTESGVTRTSAFSNSDNVVGFTDDKSNITTYINQTAGTVTGYTRSGTHLLFDRFALGALVSSSTAAWFNTRVYGLVIVARVLSGSEITSLVTWLGAKAGLTI